MNIDQEIDNHLQWIETVASLLNNEPLQETEMQELTRHDVCSLGQWMTSADAAKYQSQPVFQALEDVHRQFHQAAGELVAALQKDDEEAAFAAQQAFIRLSHGVVEQLMALKEAMH